MTEYEIRITNIAEENPYESSCIITAGMFEVYDCSGGGRMLYKVVVFEYNSCLPTGKMSRITENPRQKQLPEHIERRIKMYMATIHTLWDM
jgi:hypothetical protein